jgi:hypothetical protein
MPTPSISPIPETGLATNNEQDEKSKTSRKRSENIRILRTRKPPVHEIQSVFSVALPPKKHRSGEPCEPARRGELTKSPILSSGDKRAFPAARSSIVKRSFTIG